MFDGKKYTHFQTAGQARVRVGLPVAVRGGATATKEAVGRLRHEDGAGGVRAVKRKNESGGLIFRRWNKRPGDVCFSFGG